MSELTLKKVHRSFGDIEIIKGIDLEINSGELVVFVGPSGCGKSTLLRMISGLESVSDGQIFIKSKDVTRVAPAKRGIAMVFQSYALFPHMTVAENITFGLRLGGMEPNEVKAKLAEVANILRITQLLDRHPKQLSGGQRQRVAIGRAIIRKPDVFLFDEPLSNLDAELRVQMRLEIARLHSQLGATMVYVTHDQVEAMTLANRIVVLNAGRIEQVGTPMDLYKAPANRFVAQFIGSPKMNFFTSRVSVKDGVGSFLLGATLLRLPDQGKAQSGDEITLGIRPEALFIGDASNKLFDAEVMVVEHLGGENIAYLSVPSSTDLVSVKLASSVEPKVGDIVPVGMLDGTIHIFNKEGSVIGRTSGELLPCA